MALGSWVRNCLYAYALCPVPSEGEAYSFTYLSVLKAEPRVNLEHIRQMVTMHRVSPERQPPQFTKKVGATTL